MRCTPTGAFLVLVAAAAFAKPAGAIEVQVIDVRYESGLYKVTFAADLDADPASVAKVLKDYVHYPLLDKRIEDSHPLTAPTGQPPRLYTKLKGCLNRVFCRSMIRVENLQESDGALVATAIPSLSDVHSSVTRTEWRASEKGTHVSYTLALDPKFWVPAFYARRAMIETMRTGTVAMFTSVEHAAQVQMAGNANGQPEH